MAAVGIAHNDRRQKIRNEGMGDEHGLTLLESEMDAIKQAIKEDEAFDIGVQCWHCGELHDTKDGYLCKPCDERIKQDHYLIKAFEKDGHTTHCAKRMVWGDGECECGKGGVT